MKWSKPCWHLAPFSSRQFLSPHLITCDLIWKTCANSVDDIATPVVNNVADHLTRLQKLYTQLAEKLSAESVAAELFQNDALSLAQLQKVQFSQTPVEAAQYLLNLLLAASVSYDCFLKALKATRQEHINLWLTYDGTMSFSIFYRFINCTAA
jgi:hypothetical protein